MLTIQEVGEEVLGGHPRKFYVFAGDEYGVKRKYLDALSRYYSRQVKECPSVQQLLDMMSTKHLIPLAPALYVVRYDEEFLSTLSDRSEAKISSTNIVGTIVCIYSSDIRGVPKLDKYLPTFTVEIPNISEAFLLKHLHVDFPDLPDRLIQFAATYGSDYNDAQNICMSMSLLPPEKFSALSDAALSALFGKISTSKENAFKQGVAAKNFPYLLTVLDTYDDSLDGVYYTILSTLLELEKLMTNTYTDSPLRDYVKRWTPADIYNMFMNTYQCLQRSRTYSVDLYSSIVYLCSLLMFSEIPSVEVLQ